MFLYPIINPGCAGSFSYFQAMENGSATQTSEQINNTLHQITIISASPDLSSHYVPVKLEEYEPPGLSAKKLLKKAKDHCQCDRRCITSFLFKLFPVIEWLPHYSIKEQLLGDIISGLLVGIVAIPQSISYSILASQDPIYGLYTNFFCAIIYFAMATSRHNCVGSFGVLCLMIGESVNRQLKLAGYELDDSVPNATLNGTIACDKSCYAITVATALTFLVGLYQVRLLYIRCKVLLPMFISFEESVCTQMPF